MAYRKSMFMNSKGFASHLNLQSGDDDLFINEVATKSNTKVEIEPDSKTISEPKYSWDSWIRQKERHLSTSPHYKLSTKALLGFELATRFTFYVAFIASMLIGNYVTMGIAGICFITRYLTQYIVINKTARLFKERRYWIGILFMDIMIPIVNFIIHTNAMLHSGSTYEWK